MRALTRPKPDHTYVDSDRHYIKLPGITRKFSGFNRNPYLASFYVEGSSLLLANCHLLYGPQHSTAAKEGFYGTPSAEGLWCDLRRGDKHAWTKNILAVGDFNLPEAVPGDPIFEALTDRGLKLPPHGTTIPTNVSNDSDYDQIAVTPGLMSKIVKEGVFDVDGAVFSDMYDRHAPGYWRTCAKYYISDHRPLWMQFQL